MNRRDSDWRRTTHTPFSFFSSSAPSTSPVFLTLPYLSLTDRRLWSHPVGVGTGRRLGSRAGVCECDTSPVPFGPGRGRPTLVGRQLVYSTLCLSVTDGSENSPPLGYRRSEEGLVGHTGV